MAAQIEGPRVALWSRLDDRGSDRCLLARTRGGWVLDGLVMLPVDGVPAVVRYRVQTDDEWRTREASVSMSGAMSPGMPERPDGMTERILLRVESGGRWEIERAVGHGRAGGRDEVAAVAGFVDVDLGLTPATNTLPIRRLRLGVGEAADVDAVWVRWPDLAVEPLPQRYTRLDDRRYRYESGNGAFSTILTVDEHGLVVDYPDYWERIAAA